MTLMAAWVDTEDLCPTGTCPDLGTDPSVIEDACWLASSVMYEFTGRLWPGPSTEKLRPCGYRTNEACGCGLLSSACRCGGYRTVELPSRPVTRVVEVKIDGMVLDPDRYLLAGYELIYQPESETSAVRTNWPCCQRLDRPDTAVDTWSIVYEFGVMPPPEAVGPTATLAYHLTLSKNGNKKCRLPDRVTAVTRQGISMAVLDPLTLFDDGKTGISEVDLYLASLRYGRNNRPARVFAVDQMHRQGRTGY